MGWETRENIQPGVWVSVGCFSSALGLWTVKGGAISFTLNKELQPRSEGLWWQEIKRKREDSGDSALVTISLLRKQQSIGEGFLQGLV